MSYCRVVGVVICGLFAVSQTCKRADVRNADGRIRSVLGHAVRTGNMGRASQRRTRSASTGLRRRNRAERAARRPNHQSADRQQRGWLYVDVRPGTRNLEPRGRFIRSPNRGACADPRAAKAEFRVLPTSDSRSTSSTGGPMSIESQGSLSEGGAAHLARTRDAVPSRCFSHDHVRELRNHLPRVDVGLFLPVISVAVDGSVDYTLRGASNLVLSQGASAASARSGRLGDPVFRGKVNFIRRPRGALAFTLDSRISSRNQPGAGGAKAQLIASGNTSLFNAHLNAGISGYDCNDGPVTVCSGIIRILHRRGDRQGGHQEADAGSGYSAAPRRHRGLARRQRFHADCTAECGDRRAIRGVGRKSPYRDAVDDGQVQRVGEPARDVHRSDSGEQQRPDRSLHADCRRRLRVVNPRIVLSDIDAILSHAGIIGGTLLSIRRLPNWA